MGQLATILLEPEQRAESTVVSATVTKPESSEQKTGKPKTRKPVFGKVAKHLIERPAEEQGIEVHRPYGERGDFEKITVTLPSDVRGMLLDESIRRKKDHSPDWPIAAIVREAIATYLRQKPVERTNA